MQLINSLILKKSMQKKIAVILLSLLLALPLLSSAKDQNGDNPFDRIWDAVENLQSRLATVEEGSVTQAEHEQDVDDLQQQIDGLTCRLSGEESCAAGEGEGESDGDGGDTPGEPVRCGEGICSRSVPASQECIPGEPEEEVCDGLDNDCDGIIDEGLNVLGSCEAYPGGGAQSGSLVCDDMGGVVCQPN